MQKKSFFLVFSLVLILTGCQKYKMGACVYAETHGTSEKFDTHTLVKVTGQAEGNCTFLYLRDVVEPDGSIRVHKGEYRTYPGACDQVLTVKGALGQTEGEIECPKE